MPASSQADKKANDAALQSQSRPIAGKLAMAAPPQLTKCSLRPHSAALASRRKDTRVASRGRRRHFRARLSRHGAVPKYARNQIGGRVNRLFIEIGGLPLHL